MCSVGDLEFTPCSFKAPDLNIKDDAVLCEFKAVSLNSQE